MTHILLTRVYQATKCRSHFGIDEDVRRGHLVFRASVLQRHEPTRDTMTDGPHRVERGPAASISAKTGTGASVARARFPGSGAFELTRKETPRNMKNWPALPCSAGGEDHCES